MKTIIYLSAILLALSSCEYSYNYSYIVTNKTDDTINVYVKTFQIDSTFTIAKGTTKTLFIDNHGIEPSKGPYFDDVANDLKAFTVSKTNAQQSTRDYLQNEAWSFHKGEYTTVVDNDEFK